MDAQTLTERCPVGAKGPGAQGYRPGRRTLRGMVELLLEIPAVRRNRVAIAFGMWVAMLVLLLVSASTFLAVQSVSLGDLRFIGTDQSVASGVVSRLVVMMAAVLALAAQAIRAYALPVQPVHGGSSPAAAARQAGVIRLAAGAGLLVVAVSGALLSGASHLFG